MKENKIIHDRLFITDLDGTLLRKDGRISPIDINCLRDLRRNGIITAIATGRSLFSFNSLSIPDDMIDYLIFSTGAGIMDMMTGEIIYSEHMNSTLAGYGIECMIGMSLDFMVHGPIPDSHYMLYHRSGRTNSDFEERLAIYRPFSAPLEGKCPWDQVTQLLAVVPEDSDELIALELFRRLHHSTVIWSRSPLDRKSIWIEIFSPVVSKGKTAAWLAKSLGLDRLNVAAVGNDTNDIDLLQWAGSAYSIYGSPSVVSENCTVVSSNDDNGVAMAASHWIGRKNKKEPVF